MIRKEVEVEREAEEAAKRGMNTENDNINWAGQGRAGRMS